jgi:hypothetical protein
VRELNNDSDTSFVLSGVQLGLLNRFEKDIIAGRPTLVGEVFAGDWTTYHISMNDSISIYGNKYNQSLLKILLSDDKSGN